MSVVVLCVIVVVLRLFVVSFVLVVVLQSFGSWFRFCFGCLMSLCSLLIDFATINIKSLQINSELGAS